MKLYFENCDSVLSGVELLKDDMNFEIVSKHDADLTVVGKSVDTDISQIEFKNNTAVITYGDKNGIFNGKSRFFRAFSKLMFQVNNGKKEFSSCENPLFTVDGTMVDMSRNSVMTVDSVLTMFRSIARMGMNTFMLYTEDTYEISEKPYFGYMRGRYTQDEIKKMDEYAIKLGIELVPCIQVLGHLATYLHWNCTNGCKDTANVLLADCEETDKFIEEMFVSIKNSFSSRNIHIGMDETHDLGTGKYLDKNGFVPRKEIYLRHLSKMSKIAEKHGFKPMIWSDMFFRLLNNNLPGYQDYDERITLTDEIVNLVPENIKPVFWDYYHDYEEFYTHGIKEHKKFKQNTVFAGGVWCWSCYSMLLQRTLDNTVPALNVCKREGVKEVLATVWHNGAEASRFSSLAGLAVYADYDYKNDYYPENSCLYEIFGRNVEEFLIAGKVDYPCGYVGSTRALMANDPLCGLLDANIKGLPLSDFYGNLEKDILKLTEKEDIFTPCFKMLASLCNLFAMKADFGIRLKNAYDSKDRKALELLSEECDRIVASAEKFHGEYKNMWLFESKPFGLEVFDLRHGYVISRIKTAKERIDDYLSGKRNAIEELEAERLPYNCTPVDPKNPFGPGAVWFHFNNVASAGVL